MISITAKQQKIIEIILGRGAVRSSDVYQELLNAGEEISHVSVKRALSVMVRLGVITTSGSGRSTHYNIGTLGRIFAAIDEKHYTAIDPDKRLGLGRYNFDLFREFPGEVFDKNDLSLLAKATGQYQRQAAIVSEALRNKELQRIIIELSWKSSKIEGNTYSLLDTERLIVRHQEAPGHKKSEAKMILNHKDAFLFVRKHEGEYQTLNIKNIEKLHAILTKDLGVNEGLRKGLIGITGSKYRPLDNIHQIREAIESLGRAISRATTPYDKALLALVGISYIQPFEDGNKRTGRLMANALLLSHNCAPLSYRSVDENEYRGAMLVFYEINSIIPFAKLFKEQYLFAAQTYAAT